MNVNVNSGGEAADLTKRQRDLTQELAIHIIQIVTRNKATNPNNPENDVMIRLMRDLLQHEHQVNGAGELSINCVVV